MERDKLKLEVTTLQNDKNKQISLVEDLEKDLVLTKQKLGEVLNELSEAEQAKINTERIGEKKGKYSFFSKKK
jgi:hypothetical protein